MVYTSAFGVKIVSECTIWGAERGAFLCDETGALPQDGVASAAEFVQRLPDDGVIMIAAEHLVHRGAHRRMPWQSDVPSSRWTT